jgi:hypothetical protein
VLAAAEALCSRAHNCVRLICHRGSNTVRRNSLRAKLQARNAINGSKGVNDKGWPQTTDVDPK